MPFHPDWTDIALRLFITLLAGGAIGFDRGARGHAAGLRTVILVMLAASVAMILANFLLSTEGKTSTSFARMDTMRMALGILTGVGFIGGGAILKRGELIAGVTTAATLWVATVIGLCIGSDQLVLGVAATALTVLTLWGLRRFEIHIPREHWAELVVAADTETVQAPDIGALLRPLGYSVTLRQRWRTDSSSREHFKFDVGWTRAEASGPPPDPVETLRRRYEVCCFEIISQHPHAK